jgi:multicomponent Na+:H+ antiporter subunit B
LASTALILYGLIKGYVFITAFLGIHTVSLQGTVGSILSGGFILPLNILVGMVVAITFYFIAILFEEGDIEYANFAE